MRDLWCVCEREREYKCKEKKPRKLGEGDYKRDL